jgi:ABC-2 type transport system ATP-binding protein
MNSELLCSTVIDGSYRKNVGEGTAILVKGVTKSFGRINALKGMDLSVPTGSVFALLGRNAAGKSTLLQLILGLLEPSSGSISVLNMDPRKDAVKLRRKLGYVPEHLPMYEWMTVAEILRFVGAQYPNWSNVRQDQLVKSLQIPLTQKVWTLSRGQRALLVSRDA